jgi:hypothetical protein
MCHPHFTVKVAGASPTRCFSTQTRWLARDSGTVIVPVVPTRSGDVDAGAGSDAGALGAALATTTVGGDDSAGVGWGAEAVAEATGDVVPVDVADGRAGGV